MGNVVSSLLMYALQAAWFCQRLIDQDYRQNHGSRPKPIMDIDETDLDVFLSKCRSYYMTKTYHHQSLHDDEADAEKSNRSRSCGKGNFWSPARELERERDTLSCRAEISATIPDRLQYNKSDCLFCVDDEQSLREKDMGWLVTSLSNSFTTEEDMSDAATGVRPTGCSIRRCKNHQSQVTRRWKRKNSRTRRRHKVRCLDSSDKRNSSANLESTSASGDGARDLTSFESDNEDFVHIDGRNPWTAERHRRA